MKIKPSLVIPTVSAAALIGAAIACAPENGSNTSSPLDQVAGPQAQPTDQGAFVATFVAFNNLFDEVNGDFSANVSGDTVTVRLGGQGVLPGSVLRAQIRSGSRCLTAADDTNGDGYVDAIEARPIIGDVLIPLDEDITLQQDANDNLPGPSPTPASGYDDQPDYPGVGRVVDVLQATPAPSPTPGSDTNTLVGNDSGAFAYSTTASLSAILRDLAQPDPNPGDELGKLGAGKTLDLENRIVVLVGVPSGLTLPPTVRSSANLSLDTSIVTACGEIVRTGGPAPAPTVSPGQSPSPSPTATP